MARWRWRASPSRPLPPGALGRRARRPALAVLVVLALVAVAVPVGANHPQTANGKTVVFDHKTGNEFWVEVVLTGPSASTVTRVEAQESFGLEWHTLEKKSWGAYAASFRISPGEDVRFRATWADGTQIVSCWFTHPAGVEKCSAPPPAGEWQLRHIGNAGISSGSGELAVGDADNDGRRDVVQASRNGVFHFEWDGTAWRTQQVGTTTGTSAVVVGDGDNDGRSEVYAARTWDVVRFDWTGAVWTETVIVSVPEPVAGDMTFGDIDGQPGREIYLGVMDGTDAAVYKIRFASGAWSAQRIARTPGNLDSLWVGDGDRDGAFELYVGHGLNDGRAMASRLRFVNGGWEFFTFDQTTSPWGERFVVAGDGDRDGRPEIYAISDGGELRRIAFRPATGWNVQTVLHLADTPVTGLFLGDADLEPGAELYATTTDSVHHIRWDGLRWVATEVAHPIDGEGLHAEATMVVVGDGDGDGRSEAYVSASFFSGVPWDPGHTEVYQLSQRPLPSTFDATFTGVRGNEWWVQANVAANGGTLASVDVRLNGGAWQPLTKQSWGGWAKSTRIVQGTQVQFRAISTTGATDLSDCYQWIPPSNQDAAKVACGSAPPPPAFDATFSGVKGNEWWVQANVAANQPLAGVDARVNCGTWQPLTLQSWGGWAKSFHVPDGSKVDFRARSTTGAQDVSGGYVWPSATPTSGC